VQIFILGFRVALQFVHEMQNKSQKNFDASRDRSLPVFGVGVAFIDESSIFPVPSHEIDKAIQEIRLIVSNLAPPRKEFHVVPIENICSSNSSDGRDRLNSLLDVVSDATGKEDLLDISTTSMLEREGELTHPIFFFLWCRLPLRMDTTGLY